MILHLAQQLIGKIAPPVMAATNTDISILPEGPFASLANLRVEGIISGLVTLLLVTVALVFFFMLILGGLKWITAGGDEKSVGAARTQITNALIGLAIVFAAWAIVALIGNIFGISLLGNLYIPDFIQ